MTELSKYRFQFRNAKKTERSKKYDVLFDSESENERKRRRDKKHEKGISKKRIIEEYPHLIVSVLNF